MKAGGPPRILTDDKSRLDLYVIGSIIIFLCVLSQLGVGDAWDAGRATSP